MISRRVPLRSRLGLTTRARRDDLETQAFDGVAVTGMQVYYYPMGIRSENTRPYIGFIRWGHPGGIADITLLPDQSGACDVIDQAVHVGCKAAVDEFTGGIHPNAKKRGTWEFVPWVWESIKAKKPVK